MSNATANSSTSGHSPVVETLLQAHEGDYLRVECQRYEYANPLAVASIDDTRWRCPTGGVWRSRRLTLESNPHAPGRSATATVDAYQDGPRPTIRTYGEIVDCEPANPDTPADTTSGVDVEFTERPPSEIVADSPVRRTLAEVLDAAEQADGILDVHQRIAANTVQQTRDLLWQLGLRGSDGQLLADSTLADRLEQLRDATSGDRGQITPLGTAALISAIGAMLLAALVLASGVVV